MLLSMVTTVGVVTGFFLLCKDIFHSFEASFLDRADKDRLIAELDRYAADK